MSDSEKCPNCGHEASQGAYCAHCGARLCSWQELEARTATEPGRAEALAALAQAPTARTAAILLDQYHGALDRALATVRDALRAGDTEQADRLLGDLTRFSGLGRHLAAPPATRCVGRLRPALEFSNSPPRWPGPGRTPRRPPCPIRSRRCRCRWR